MSANRPTMLARASRMRRAPTEAERRLWNQLRASQLDGYKFRRQAMIDSRIVDFFCPEKGLIIELDGDTHEPGHDAVRDAKMKEEQGFSTLRFHNRQVMENIEGVLLKLLAVLIELPDRWAANTTPDPSSEEEGRRTAYD